MARCQSCQCAPTLESPPRYCRGRIHRILARQWTEFIFISILRLMPLSTDLKSVTDGVKKQASGALRAESSFNSADFHMCILSASFIFLISCHVAFKSFSFVQGNITPSSTEGCYCEAYRMCWLSLIAFFMPPTDTGSSIFATAFRCIEHATAPALIQ